MLYITPATTPVEIDTEIARLQGEAAQAFAQAAGNRKMIARLEKRIEEGNAYEISVSGGIERMRADIVTLTDAALDAEQRGRKLMLETEPLHEEWVNRGQWNRYYFVVSSDGHVHSSMHCSTCYPTTGYHWLTEYSGMDQHEFVEKIAKAAACTTCYDWAPVNVLRQKTKLELPERRKARLEREAKAAAKAEKARIKGITNPDGSSLEVPEFGGTRIIQTEIAANNAAMAAAFDLEWYNVVLKDQGSPGPHPSTQEWEETVRLCVAALAHKRGTKVEDELAAINKKVATKIRRGNF